MRKCTNCGAPIPASVAKLKPLDIYTCNSCQAKFTFVPRRPVDFFTTGLFFIFLISIDYLLTGFEKWIAMGAAVVFTGFVHVLMHRQTSELRPIKTLDTKPE